MNLFLGIYSKKEELDYSGVSSVLDDFSAHRKVKTIRTDNFLISCSSNNPNNPNFNLSKKENVIVAVSGNIINYSEAENFKKYGASEPKMSSSDYILELYLRNEEIDFAFFDGEFAVAIYDCEKKHLSIANNVFGTFPLFIFSDSNYFVFCNEYEPITKYNKFDNDISKIKIAEYLILGSPINGKTLFKSIENLRPATKIDIIGSSISEKRYDNSRILINNNLSIPEIASKFSNLLKETVEKRTDNFESIYSALTGGLDTRLILSAMRVETRKKTIFTSLYTTPLNENNDRDVLIAKQISSKLKIQHQISPMSEFWSVWYKDFDCNFFSDLRYSKIPYILSGHFGNELLNGGFIGLIPPIIMEALDNKNHISIDFINDKYVYGKNAKFMQNPELYHKEIGDYFPEVLENLVKEIKSYNCENNLLLYAINQMTRSFFSTMYTGSFGSWLMTYRFPIGWNLPFIDRNILELLLSVPLTVLTNKNQIFYNEIYKNNFPELINIPTSSTFGTINGNCISYFDKGKEPKNEFTPRYHNTFDDLLIDERIEELKMFNIEHLKKYKGKGNSIEVRPFIELSIWLRSRSVF